MNIHQSYVFVVIHVVGGVCCGSSCRGSEEMKKVYVRRKKWRR